MIKKYGSEPVTTTEIVERQHEESERYYNLHKTQDALFQMNVVSSGGSKISKIVSSIEEGIKQLDEYPKGEIVTVGTSDIGIVESKNRLNGNDWYVSVIRVACVNEDNNDIYSYDTQVKASQHLHPADPVEIVRYRSEYPKLMDALMRIRQLHIGG